MQRQSVVNDHDIKGSQVRLKKVFDLRRQPPKGRRHLAVHHLLAELADLGLA